MNNTKEEKKKYRLVGLKEFKINSRFTVIQDEAFDDDRLNVYERMLYMYYLKYSSKYGYCSMSNQALMNKLNIGRKKFYETKQNLINLGLIISEQEYQGAKAKVYPNVYVESDEECNSEVNIGSVLDSYP